MLGIAGGVLSRKYGGKPQVANEVFIMMGTRDDNRSGRVWVVAICYCSV